MRRSVAHAAQMSSSPPEHSHCCWQGQGLPSLCPTLSKQASLASGVGCMPAPASTDGGIHKTVSRRVEPPMLSVSPEPCPGPALHTPDKGRLTNTTGTRRHVKAVTAAKSGTTLHGVRASGCSHCGHFLLWKLELVTTREGECKTLYNSMQEGQRV